MRNSGSEKLSNFGSNFGLNQVLEKVHLKDKDEMQETRIWSN